MKMFIEILQWYLKLRMLITSSLGDVYKDGR